MNYRLLFKAGVTLGIVTLTVGVLIFVTWWLARVYFAVDLESLVLYGFYWIIISLFIATTGLLLIFVSLIRNYPNHIPKHLIGILVVLLNIPSLYLILSFQQEVESRAYVKFINSSTKDLTRLQLFSALFDQNLGSLNSSQSFVRYFYPKYLDFGVESIRSPDSVFLVIEQSSIVDTLVLPPIWKGQCTTIVISDHFELLQRDN